MLDVKSIDLHYGAAQALRGITLAAEPGKVTCVLGRNGVGKTSLLRALTGHHPVSRGTIEFDGNDITALKPYERARRGIAYVPQGREIFPLLTVQENLETGFAPLRRADREIPDDVFSLFPVLHDMLRRRGGDLSGGQQQQLAIGRALVMRPRLLLLDEPTEGIQPSIIKDIAPRDRLSAQPRPDGDHAGRAVSRLRPRAGRPFCRDGARRDRLFVRAATTWTKRPSSAPCRYDRVREASGVKDLTADHRAEIFAANRARGRIALAVGATRGVTHAAARW